MKICNSISTILFLVVLWLLTGLSVYAEDGYDLWLRYAQVTDKAKAGQVKKILGEICLAGNTPTMKVIEKEIGIAGSGMLGIQPAFSNRLSPKTGWLIGLLKS